MKKLMSVSLLIVLLMVIAGYAENATVEATIRTATQGDSFFVDFYIRSLTTANVIPGNATLTINYNKEALTYLAKISKFDGPWDNGNPSVNGAYLDCFTVVQQPYGRAALNFGRSAESPDNAGCPIPRIATRVGRMAFLIADKTKQPSLSWSKAFSALTDVAGMTESAQPVNFVSEMAVPVEVSTFSGVSSDGMVQLDWVTGLERNNLGFHIYRSESAYGGYQQVNAQLIEGKGNSAGEVRYTFEDKNVEVGKKYYYQIADVDFSGRITMDGMVDLEVQAPKEYALLLNYPNPFNPTTTIQFKIKEPGLVKLEVFNVIGQGIRTLVSGQYKPGSYSVVWDGKDSNGVAMPSGNYFYRLKVNDFDKVIKMQMLK
jgi:hypothetical protein